MNKTACAYFRTSSATNVGSDKDSLPRQQDAVRAYAAAHGIEIVHEYYDAAVSGADPVHSREGFAEMLAYIKSNGARTILVETANRFARDLMVQETGHRMLKQEGIELVAVDSPECFTSDTPTATMIRQILGAVSQFEKAMVVAKLKGGRDRKHRLDPTWREGNPNIASVAAPVPAAHVEAARQAAARDLSLRAIAVELAASGHVARSGKPYGPQSIKRMLAA